MSYGGDWKRWLAVIALAAIAVVIVSPSLWAQDGGPEQPVINPAAMRMPTNVIEMIQALGIWVYPFAAVSLITVWSTVERFVMLRRSRVIPKPFVQRFLKLVETGELERDEALLVCEENESPIAMIFAHGVRKWGKTSVEVEQAIIDGGERQVAALRKNLRALSGAYTISPLLGLLGTVWGMLISFEKIANSGAMGNSQQLAAGIALALVTTAAGLAIAIPSIIIYMYLVGRVDNLVMEMDELSQRLVNSISAEALAERASRSKRVAREPEPVVAGKKKVV
jgi:biopolymer transport protein ExbB